MRLGDPNSRLSIIVPVFNEAPNISANLHLLISEVEETFPNFEIIVVSDGSTDGTSGKLLSFRHPGLKSIIFERNVGKGNAIRSGFARADGDYILFIGSKRHPQSRIDYPWYRRSLSWVYQRIVRALFDVDVTDTQVGIKLFRAEVVKAVLPHLQIDRYGFDLEILSLARLAGYRRVLEAPIRLDYFNNGARAVPLDLLHVFRVGFALMRDTLALYFRLRAVRIEKTRIVDGALTHAHRHDDVG